MARALGQPKPLRREFMNFRRWGWKIGLNLGSGNKHNPQKVAGVNLSLFGRTDRAQAGLNASMLNSVGDVQAGINIGVFANCAKRQMGATLGAANFSDYQSGLTVGLFQMANCCQSGATLGLFNSSTLQKFATIGFVNTASEQQGINVAVFNHLTEQSLFNGAGPAYQAGINIGASNVARDQSGLTFALFNRVKGVVKGAAVSAISIAGNVNGFAAGIFSRCRKMAGVSLSAVSQAGRVKGVSASALWSKAGCVQGVLAAPLTIVGDSRSSTGVQIGLLNIRKDETKWWRRYRPLLAINTAFFRDCIAELRNRWETFWSNMDL